MLIKSPVIIISLVIFIVFKLFPPKEINHFYGYRTSNSMKSPHHWAYAQKYSVNVALVITSILLLCQILVFSFFGSSTVTDLMLIGVWLIGVIMMIYKTEKKLKAFDNSHNTNHKI